MKHSKTPLLGLLQKAFRQAQAANSATTDADALQVESVETDFGPLSRRRFLTGVGQAGLALGGGLLLTPWLAQARSQQRATIAIIGGGIAGLNAAYQLQKRGFRATVYEAADRLGGRIHTIAKAGLATELGGEFIDSGHEDMLALVREFRLPLFDTQKDTKNMQGRRLIKDDYFFGGRRYAEKDVVAKFRPLAGRIEKAANSLPDDNYQSSQTAQRLDNLSIKQYLKEIGAEGWFYNLLDAAFTSEFGLEIEEQSALNFITLIGTDTATGKFEVFGESDERYKITGGNGTLIARLSRKLAGQIETGYKLEAVKQNGAGFVLDFAGRPEVKADIVVLTVPFSVLRQVKLPDTLPPAKRKVINELGYGTNAKMILPFRNHLWRGQGYAGYLFNEKIQNGWDAGQGRSMEAKPTNYTAFVGGSDGKKLDKGDANSYLDKLEQVYAGSRKASLNDPTAANWHDHKHTLGSYACYKVGQWTTLAGNEFTPVGNLYFAGEHCSSDFQGYMNGGAETGRRVAQMIAKKLRRSKPVKAGRR